METEEAPIDFIDLFMALPLGETMKIPANLLSPTTADDWIGSYSEGPIEVYALHRKNEKGKKITKIWIADGNHRYFDQLREASFKANLNGEEFSENQLMVQAIKIKPHRDNDIRYMFNATEWHE